MAKIDVVKGGLKSNDEILRPYCPVCKNIMHEIGADDEVVYICDCGASGNPVFIDTGMGDWHASYG